MIPDSGAGSQVSTCWGAPRFSPLCLQTAHKVKGKVTSEATQSSVESSSPSAKTQVFQCVFPKLRELGLWKPPKHRWMFPVLRPGQPSPAPSPGGTGGDRKQGRSPVSHSSQPRRPSSGTPVSAPGGAEAITCSQPCWLLCLSAYLLHLLFGCLTPAHARRQKPGTAGRSLPLMFQRFHFQTYKVLKESAWVSGSLVPVTFWKNCGF